MSNLYKTPESELSAGSGHLDEILATKWSRLFAALLDGILGFVVALPFWWLSGGWEYISQGQEPPITFTLLGGLYGFITFIIVHGYFLKNSGQTIGKKALGIKITNMDGELVNMGTMLGKRYLPLSLAGIIPLIGQFLVLIDLLFIFRKNRRCVHDLIAGTQVIKC